MIRCAYCRATHDSHEAFMACAHRRIAWDALDYAQDKADEQFVDDALDCADADLPPGLYL